MIRVSNLTKRYAGVAAVDDISFTVERGEIVGFLGPNGAGKSTTMRILTGYMPATFGKVKIAGMDLPENSLKVRKKRGKQTLLKFSKKLGISDASLHRLEMGEQNVTLRTLEQIMRRLGCSFDDVFKEWWL